MAARRQGIAILELMAAAILIAALAAVTLQFLGSASVARRGVERRTVALEEAANAIERMKALPWNEVTSERLREAIVPPIIAAIPGASARAILETQSDPPARHVAIEIVWKNALGNSEAPVRLNYWLYPARGNSP